MKYSNIFNNVLLFSINYFSMAKYLGVSILNKSGIMNGKYREILSYFLDMTCIAIFENASVFFRGRFPAGGSTEQSRVVTIPTNRINEYNNKTFKS